MSRNWSLHLLGLRGVADILLRMVASNTGQIHRLGRITIDRVILDKGISTEVNTIGHLVGINTSRMDQGHQLQTSNMVLIIAKDLLQKTEIWLRLIQILGRDSVQLLLKGFVVKVVGIITALLEDQHGEDFLSRLHQVNSIIQIIEDVPNNRITRQGMVV